MASGIEKWMARAVRLSLRGFPAPNPRVGCVIVKNGEIVGEGYHDHAGAPHAESMALAMAGSSARGADVFVTLEPCAHHGRTPPCSEALVKAGVKRVWLAVPDPNPIASGGTEYLREHGIDVKVGLLADEARSANRVFLTSFEMSRPYVCLKAAVTVDGFMTREDGSSQWITGPRARSAGQRLRAEMGSVLVGWKTVQRDKPLLTARIKGVVNQPVRIVIDPHARLAGGERVFEEPGRTLWFVGKGRRTLDAQMEAPSGETFDLDWLLEAVQFQGVRGILVEGGPRTLAHFMDRGLFDSVELFVGPNQFGSGARFPWPGSPSGSLKLRAVKKIGGDVQMSFLRDF
ncbi:MAG: bifunctional diaminohydroxyphosphoribosylaminopyrimidine deaminase/5-amino-6-(5-phosphoribosylamino)uracil reductase RibD [Armatimonadetes bacterium]|nr:bifunctional diaminohydroxyphosphoribosylaminopyrimidine deaminase/5-amino-6-(5-phosphoribosylamino)uracil reductase RibD [Armatimonadota bacterium]